MKNLFYFNPTCEMAIANGSVSYQAPKLLQELERDLGVLPCFFAGEGDGVVVERRVSAEFKQDLKRYFRKSTPFLLRHCFEQAPVSFERFCPWGWSPAVEHLFFPFASYAQMPFNRISPARMKDLYSRRFALEVLEKLQKNCGSDLLMPSAYNARVCHSIHEVEQLTFGAGMVLKAPWSSSGRGVQILHHRILNESNKAWIKGVLKSQGSIMVEQLLDKLMDLSFHFHVSNGQVKIVGRNYFTTNSKGKYLGSYVGSSFWDKKEEERVFEDSGILDDVQRGLAEILSASVLLESYGGYLGVDALLYRDQQGRVLLQPVLEINPRYTMGLLSIFLHDYIHPCSQGFWSIEMHQSEADKIRWVAEQQRTHPTTWRDGLLASGCIPLSDHYGNTHFSAWLRIKAGSLP